MADIVFLVESSTNVGQENFQKVKKFLYTLISKVHAGSNQIRIGLAQYSEDTYGEFLLNRYSLKNDILEHIQNLLFRSGGTFTGAALDFIKKEYFIRPAGNRAQENVPQIAILITAGESNDEVKVAASQMRARGISIYVVGIGVQDITQLKEIASKPLHKFLFTTDSFNSLENLTRRFLRHVCFAVESQRKGKSNRLM